MACGRRRGREVTQRDRDLLMGYSGVTAKRPEVEPKTDDRQKKPRAEAATSGELKVPGPLIYPCMLAEKPSIWLDKVCKSMYYLWFPQKLARDMVLIRIQQICRETLSGSGGRIHIDNGYIEQGRIVIRINLAEPDDGGRAFWQAVLDILWVLCTTTNMSERSNFLSDLARYGEKKSQR